MEPLRPRIPRRRPRPGSLERPVNGRLVRGALLIVALPLLLAAFTVARPEALQPPTLPPVFDTASAVELAQELSRDHPDRTPGSLGALEAAHWFTDKLSLYGFPARSDRWRQSVPGLGTVELQNIVAVVPGSSPQAIVFMANRDNTGAGPGANDNATGTAALIELARAYAASTPGESRAHPSHTLVFVSTDGGAFGAVGAARFAATSPYRKRTSAVVSLRALAGPNPPRLELSGDAPRSPSPTLVRTAAARVLEETKGEPEHPSALRQLVDLGFPLALGEQGPFVARGIPAVTLTTAPEKPAPSFGDTPERLGDSALRRRFGQLGHASQALLGSLDAGLELTSGPSSYVYFGRRIVRGWAIELVLLWLVVPFLAGAVDLLARCRRRHIALVPAARSLRSRLGFWAYVGVAFLVCTLVGLLPRGSGRPIAATSAVATEWPALGLAIFGILVLAGWLVTRERLLPRRQVVWEERLAGYAVGLVALGVVALTVAAVNPFALLFVLPSLYAWLWLPQLGSARRAAAARGALYALGLAGPLVLLVSISSRFGLGPGVFPYLLRLAGSGYVAPISIVLVLAWAATAAQLGVLAAGRYAPYPSAAERPPRGPIRELVRHSALAFRRRRHHVEKRRAAGG